jgi:hypothetical protein
MNSRYSTAQEELAETFASKALRLKWRNRPERVSQFEQRAAEVFGVG